MSGEVNVKRGQLRVLPFKYWAMHPLYFCDVRMLCCHVTLALTSIDADRNDFHILYNQHPITKYVRSIYYRVYHKQRTATFAECKFAE
jgi:hypothetical protein